VIPLKDGNSFFRNLTEWRIPMPPLSLDDLFETVLEAFLTVLLFPFFPLFAGPQGGLKTNTRLRQALISLSERLEKVFFSSLPPGRLFEGLVKVSPA